MKNKITVTRLPVAPTQSISLNLAPPYVRDRIDRIAPVLAPERRPGRRRSEWRCEIPDLEGGRIYWAPNDVLFAYFDEVMKQTQRPEKAFVMSLLMLRRRMLKLEQTIEDETGKRMVLKSPRHDNRLEIAEVSLTAEQIKELQQELGEHLFTDRAAGEEPVD